MFTVLEEGPVYGHTSFYYTLLYYIFLQIESLWQPCLSKSVGTIFQWHLVTSYLCRILVIQYFKLFHYICYSDL